MVEDLKEALAEEEGSLQGEWPGSVAGPREEAAVAGLAAGGASQRFRSLVEAVRDLVNSL
jgi:hypothetical protein